MARPSSDIPERIIESAREHFAKVGVDAASLRKIAKGARTSVAMISYHFENKDGLFRAVVDSVYDGFLADLEAVALEQTDPVVRMVEILRRISKVNELERTTIRIVLREATVESDRLMYVISRFLNGHGRLVREALAEAQEKGQVRPVPVVAALPSLMAPVAVAQLVRPALTAVLGADMEEVFEHTIDIVLNGLLPR